MKRKHPCFREVDGILLLDKPTGLSSNQALQRARRLFGAEKGGHTGSLDPLATGLLPLCFGEATKIAGLLLAERKAYETVAILGVETDTADADGVAVACSEVPELDASHVRSALKAFIGRIEQVPPIYSALKRDGEPLYARARRGETIEIEAREVEVYAIELLGLDEARLRLRVECGSGTYIRSLVRDLGRSLGCGAHVGELRRLWVDPFRNSRMFDFEELEQVAARGQAALDALLLPVEAGLAGFPRLDVSPDEALRLGQGQAIARLEDLRRGMLAAFAQDGRALGLVRAEEGGMVRPQRLFRWAAAGSIPASAAED